MPGAPDWPAIAVLNLVDCCELPHKGRQGRADMVARGGSERHPPTEDDPMRVEISLPVQGPVQHVMGGWVIVAMIATAALVALVI
jgi:hypothetical protein